ncbi:DUF5988 family protein [Streptomyces camponoticapitis]|nr:DUF5988 family protein [Streptomyces camponoticapitis]
MTGQEAVTIALEGGPSDSPGEAAHPAVSGAMDTVKVPHQGGYEHFERDPDPKGPGGRSSEVFRWVTRMAE